MTRRLDYERCSRTKRTNPEAERRAMENDLAITGMVELLGRPGITDDMRGTINFHIQRLQGGARPRATLLEDLLMMIAEGQKRSERRRKPRKQRTPRRPRKSRERQ